MSFRGSSLLRRLAPLGAVAAVSLAATAFAQSPPPAGTRIGTGDWRAPGAGVRLGGPGSRPRGGPGSRPLGEQQRAPRPTPRPSPTRSAFEALTDEIDGRTDPR